jgi:[calcium/calmodulin-dependent protein kinase] kinase
MDAFAMDETTPDVVSDSPTAVDFDVYDRAYQDAIDEYTKSTPSKRPTIYMTKFVSAKDRFKNIENLIDGSGRSSTKRENSQPEEPAQESEQLQKQEPSKTKTTLAHLTSALGLDSKKDEATAKSQGQ